MEKSQVTTLKLDPKTTALVLIDLQNGIVGLPLSPHSAANVVEHAAQLAASLREKGGSIAYVRVELSEMISLPADAPPMRDPNGPPPPASASQIVPQSGYQTGDLLITKRQWGAFYGTDLDQQLRRRGIRTIILGGIATNFGVESTARAAFDQGYELIFVEDAMTSVSEEVHRFPMQHVFPRMGRVRKTSEVLEAITQ